MRSRLSLNFVFHFESKEELPVIAGLSPSLNIYVSKSHENFEQKTNPERELAIESYLSIVTLLFTSLISIKEK